jgi:hypothetical protein
MKLGRRRMRKGMGRKKWKAKTSQSDLSELVDSDAGDEEEASADDEGNETDMVQSEEDYVGHE